MSVGRNDSCPCGSGKKYKKCCMRKDEIREQRAVREERFYQKKEILTKRIDLFLFEKIGSTLENRYRKTFANRASDKGSHPGFFMFWKLFFLRYENGLRGIEWFMQEERELLDPEVREMAERWQAMKPKLVMAVGFGEDLVYYEDIHTGEVYPCAADGGGRDLLAWNGCLALLEPLEDRYYVNGLRDINSPDDVMKTYQVAKEWMELEGLSYEETLTRYYPELTSVLDGSAREEKHSEHMEVTKYTYTFTIEDGEKAAAFIYNDPEFQLEHFGLTKANFMFVRGWEEYQDSQANGVVRIGHIYAKVEWKDDKIIATSYHLKHVNAMLRKFMESEGSIRFEHDEEKFVGYTEGAYFDQQAIQVEEGTDQVFGYLAQQRLLVDVERPIPLFGNRSLRNLVDQGETEKAEHWLRISEFTSHEKLWREGPDLSVTPDLNAARRELGLPLSPFVSGGESRQTSIESVVVHDEGPKVILDDEIPYYEELGFTEESKDAFFAHDLYLFYREKINGKSDSTKRKYKQALSLIRQQLENDSANHWSEVRSSFWVEDLISSNDHLSQTKQRELVSVIKAFLSWLDERKGTAYLDAVTFDSVR